MRRLIWQEVLSFHKELASNGEHGSVLIDPNYPDVRPLADSNYADTEYDVHAGPDEESSGSSSNTTNVGGNNSQSLAAKLAARIASSLNVSGIFNTFHDFNFFGYIYC